MPTTDYKEVLLAELIDRQYAAGYLTACYEDSPEAFLQGVRDVAEAHGGLRLLAEGTALNRENLYAMLSENGNPRLSSLALILRHLGMKLQFLPLDDAA